MATLTFKRQSTTFGRRFIVTLGLGLIGIVALAVASLPNLRQVFAAQPELANLPLPVLLALSLISPLILLTIACALGAALAPRLGLHSSIAEGMPVWPSLKGELPLAIASGVLIMLVAVAVDTATRPFLPPLKPGAEGLLNTVSHSSLPGILAAMLYGGLTEELLLRWGLMSLVAWLGWKLAQRGQHAPNAGVMWTAIVVTAVLFGVGHLGAVALAWDLTPLVVVRTVALNAAFGLLAGWLFWRRSLEVGMAAHMASHLALTVLTLLLALFQQ